MKNYLRILIAGFSLLCSGAPGFANFLMSPSGTVTAFAIDAANQGTSLCAAALTECGASVLINTAGAPIGVAATPLQVSLANTAANGTAVAVSLAANQSVNEAQINGVTPLMGNGVTGTGSPRVTIASDNTAFSVNSTLSAETTKVIGTTRLQGNVGGVLDAIGQNVAAPANWLQAGCQFQTTPTTISPTNGSPLQCNNAGQLLVSATGIAENTAVGTLTFSTLGAEGLSTEKTAVTTGSYGRLVTDLVGKLLILPYAQPELGLNGEITSAMTSTTSTAVTGMGAQGAGVRNYVTACTFSNSHATVGTEILLQDGSGGATLWQAPAGAVFGGAHVPFPTPIKTTANTGLFAQNVTTGANTFVSCTGYKGV